MILAVTPRLKPRAPLLTGPRAGRRDVQAGTPVLQLLRDRSFILFTVANFLQGLGYFLPALYLPCARSDTAGAADTPSLRILAQSRSVSGHIHGRCDQRRVGRIVRGRTNSPR